MNDFYTFRRMIAEALATSAFIRRVVCCITGR